MFLTFLSFSRTFLSSFLAFLSSCFLACLSICTDHDTDALGRLGLESVTFPLHLYILKTFLRSESQCDSVVHSKYTSNLRLLVVSRAVSERMRVVAAINTDNGEWIGTDSSEVRLLLMFPSCSAHFSLMFCSFCSFFSLGDVLHEADPSCSAPFCPRPAYFLPALCSLPSRSAHRSAHCLPAFCLLSARFFLGDVLHEAERGRYQAGGAATRKWT